MGNIDTDCVNLVTEDGVTAGTFFGSHVDGMRWLYSEEVAVFVQEPWYRTHRPALEVITPAAMPRCKQ